MNSGADYQTQLGVKGRLRRSVNVPRMEATIRARDSVRNQIAHGGQLKAADS